MYTSTMTDDIKEPSNDSQATEASDAVHKPSGPSESAQAQPRRGRPTKPATASSFTVRLPKDILEGITLKAHERGESIASVIRQGLREWLAGMKAIEEAASQSVNNLPTGKLTVEKNNGVEKLKFEPSLKDIFK